MSYHLRVERDALTAEEEAEEKKAPDDDEQDAEPAMLQFVTGNPHVEIISGLLHLYRNVEENGEVDEAKFIASTRSGMKIRLPSPRSTMVCIVAVPSHLSVNDLVEFIAGFREHVQRIRILRDTAPYKYMALLQFDDQHNADEFYAEYNGRHFNSMEPEMCTIVFVAKVDFHDLEHQDEGGASGSGGSSSGGASSGDGAGAGRGSPSAKSPSHSVLTRTFLPRSGMMELPTCPVCLERLDSSISGVLTTVCNHAFHCNCLAKWEDSSCPVCRYCQSMSDSIGTSACEMCDSTKSLWICLICGFIGCGRYSGEHAKEHFAETAHAYSLELETQRVWDYAGDGCVYIYYAGGACTIAFANAFLD
jgi:BRCA1-associated protein